MSSWTFKRYFPLALQNAMPLRGENSVSAAGMADCMVPLISLSEEIKHRHESVALIFPIKRKLTVMEQFPRQISMGSTMCTSRDVLHFYTLFLFLTPPPALCHFRRCLKHEKTDCHSFCSQERGVRAGGKI